MATDISALGAEERSAQIEQPRDERSAVLSSHGVPGQSGRALPSFGPLRALAARAFLSTAPLPPTQVTVLRASAVGVRPTETGCARLCSSRNPLLLTAQVSSAVQTDSPGPASGTCFELQQRPVSQQTVEASTPNAGSQTERVSCASAPQTAASRAVQTTLAGRQDNGCSADTHEVADKCVMTDGLVMSTIRGKDGSSEQACECGHVRTSSADATFAADAQPPATMKGSDETATGRNGTATASLAATATALAVPCVSACVQTEEAATSAAAPGRADAVLDMFLGMMVARQQDPLLSLEQRPVLLTHNAEAQTDRVQTLHPQDSPMVPQLHCGPPDVQQNVSDKTAPHRRRLSLDCAEPSSSAAPTAAAAVQQLALPDMEAAAAQQALMHGGLTYSVTVGGSCSEGKEVSIDKQSQSLNEALPVPSVPATPRRRIHRRLWRSGRTSEWAELLAVHNEERVSRKTYSEALTTAGALFSSTTSSDSDSCSARSDGSALEQAPIALTVACQTSPSNRDMVNFCSECTASSSSASDTSSPSDLPMACAVACQTLQTGQAVLNSGALLYVDPSAESSDGGHMSSWLTSLSLTTSEPRNA